MPFNLQSTQAGLRFDWRWKSADDTARLSPSLILAWIALALYSYRDVIGDLFQQWRSDASYSHGPVVLPIAIWFLWQRRSTLPAIAKPWVPGIGLLLIVHSLLWLGGHFHLPAVQRWTIPLYLCAMIGLLAGRGVLIWSLPAVCFLGFMIPIPFQLEIFADQFLQWASAWCSCFLLSLTSTFAVTDGYTLRMATGEVAITKDCSGLRMTVAIAALAYLITFLTEQRSCRDPGGQPNRWGIASQLCMLVLIVIPAAILANAVRITVMALVMDRYQSGAYTSWAHDLGDWFALPVAAAVFLAFRAWIGRVRQIWGAAKQLRQSSPRGSERRRFWPKWGMRSLVIGAAPVALAAIAAASIGHYRVERDRIINQTTTAARGHEENGNWTQAASCYRELLSLQPSQIETRYRHAWVSLQAAESSNERMQAFFELEAVLKQAPFHVAALRTNLEMSLVLNLATPASRSAGRLYSIDRHDSKSLRLCVEAMLRFQQDSPGCPAITAERLCNLIERFGPTSHWRDRLVIEVASFCCDHPESIDHRVTSVVEPAVAGAAIQVGSAQSFYQAWRFEHVFGNGTSSVERARLSIDGECPTEVAYKILLASAQESRLDNRPDDAKSFLKQAVQRLPNAYAAYPLLGDVLETQAEWPQCTAAYLRAWRLAGDRPIELGIKLAEALIRTERHAESAQLVTQLANDEKRALNSASRVLRIRLMLVQARLDIRADRHEDALQTIRRCQPLIVMNDRPASASTEWLSTIETLKLQCLVRLDRYAEAARVFEHRSARVDGSADQWTAAARAWQSASNPPAAERCYRSAVAKLGCDTEVWLEYVRLLRDQYGIGEAIDEVTLRQRLGLETSPISDKILAQAWEMVGRRDLAIRHYRAAAEREARDVAALAIALARHGKADEAVALVSDQQWQVSISLRAHTAAVIGVSSADLSTNSKTTLKQIIRQGAAAASNDAPLLLAAVAWYTHCRDASAAVELLGRVLTLQPENSVVGNNFAMLLADEGRDFDRALGHIDDVLKRTGPVPEFLDTKGWILVQMNRAEDALPWLRKAVERSDSAAPTALLHLATAYMAVGDRDQARDCFEAAQAGQLHHDRLNNSEQHAWQMLHNEFMQLTGEA